MPNKQEQKKNLPRRRLFIGSSSESSEHAEILHAQLNADRDLNLEITFWADAFPASQDTLAGLATAVKSNDYAVFFYAKDDVLVKRGKRQRAVRDNVIFESGLFMGSIGIENVFIVVSREDKVGILTDLSGFQLIYYERQDNLENAIRVVATRVKRTIRSRLSQEGQRKSAPSTVGVVYSELSRIMRKKGHGIEEPTLRTFQSVNLISEDEYRELARLL